MDRILTRDQTELCTFLDLEALACVTGCLTRQAQGRVGPSLQVQLPLGPANLQITTAPVDGLPSVGIRHQATQGGASSLLLLDSESGSPQALFLDGGYLQNQALALTGCLAIQHLAPSEVSTIGLLGTGPTTQRLLQALQLVRTPTRVMIPAEERIPAELRTLLEELSLVLEIAPDSSKILKSCQLLLVTERPPASLDIHLSSPLHILTVGSELASWAAKLEPHINLYTCEAVVQSSLRGQLQRPLIGLGQLTAGHHPGRKASTDITLSHLEGCPLLDTALGWLAWRKAQKYKLGTHVDPDQKRAP
jgi:ornithine cyclodeaminase